MKSSNQSLDGDFATQLSLEFPLGGKYEYDSFSISIELLKSEEAPPPPHETKRKITK